jgi:hypothetical protein
MAKTVRRREPLRTCLAIGLLSLAVCGCGSAPQFTADDECLTAVDALWTAVTAQQTPWLEQSARELERLHDDGKLSSDAWEVLEALIAQARSGQWQPAAEGLYDLIKGQRKAAKD